MRASKIPWVSHKKFPILSVDVQPNGYRFITGGTDNLVGVWNLLPVISLKYEEMGNETEEESHEQVIRVSAEENKDAEMREEGSQMSSESEDSMQGLSPEESAKKE